MPAADFLRRLYDREQHPEDPAARAAFAQAYRQLLHAATDPAARDTILHQLAAGLRQTGSAWEFGCVASTCGALVERGGDPRVALDPILAHLAEQFARVPALVAALHEHFGVDDLKAVPEHEWEAIGQRKPARGHLIDDWRSLQLTGPAAMTMLVRDAGLRQDVRARHDALRHAADVARSHSVFAYYVAELLEMADDLPLLVLDLTRNVGHRVRLTAVRNNFHLFTLLQAALWPGPEVRPAVAAVAKGERMLNDLGPSEPTTDVALWSYHQWPALRPDGTLPADHDHWVWGEEKPDQIAALDGERVVLLGPAAVERSWDVGFFAPLHANLRSAVTVEEELPPAAVAAWVERIRATPRAVP